jgi:LPS export ABC transporter protein LptC
VLAFLAAGLAGCESSDAGTGSDVPDVLSSGADQVMIGVEHYMTREGIRRAKLVADTAFTYQDSARIGLRSLKVTFYAADGTEMAVLTGRTGEYSLESGDMRVDGDVTVTGELTAGGRSRLETRSLRYDAAANRLVSESPYTLTHPDGTVESGTGFTTDPGMTKISSENFSVTAPSVEVPE